MRGPVGVERLDRLARAGVDRTRRKRLHGDAILHGADGDAKVAADAFRVDDLERTLAGDSVRDRLMRSVLTDDVAAAALDAEVLVDPRLRHVIQVQELPVGDVLNRPSLEIGEA